jgi:hypothetical protein
MKTILAFGIGAMALCYLFISMYNHTWDIMDYSEGSVYWFGSLTSLGFITGCLVRALGLDAVFDWNNPR